MILGCLEFCVVVVLLVSPAFNEKAVNERTSNPVTNCLYVFCIFPFVMICGREKSGLGTARCLNEGGQPNEKAQSIKHLCDEKYLRCGKAAKHHR